MRYRLGLDLGTSSIGWSIFRLAGEENSDDGLYADKLIRLGARIFSDGRDPKSGDSLAADRRIPRSMRRRRDRYLRRRAALMTALIREGLMPQQEVERKALQYLNPYLLRAKAVTEKISIPEFARALFHLNQRRGFQSNRKTDKGDESGKINSAIKAFRQQVGDKTLGQVLNERLLAGDGTRARTIGSGAKSTYTFYVERAMVKEEFNRIWQKQAKFYPDVLTEEKRERLFKLIFFQRPLKPVPVGKCFYYPEDKRAPLALPSAQQFRLYQELNHLRLIELVSMQERALTRDERDTLAGVLLKRDKMKLEGLRKALFGKDRMQAYQFTIERRGNRKELYGDGVSAKLAKSEHFGGNWWRLDPAEQELIVEKLLEIETETEVMEWLVRDYGVSNEQAENIARLNLPEGHLRLGRTALSKVLPALKDGWNQEANQALTYNQAVEVALGKRHTQESPDGILPELPYYGKILWRYTQDLSQSAQQSPKTNASALIRVARF